MEISRHWRLKAQRYRLEGSFCPLCSWFTFPARPVCPHCTVQPPRVAGYELALNLIPAWDRSIDTVSTNKE